MKRKQLRGRFLWWDSQANISFWKVRDISREGKTVSPAFRCNDRSKRDGGKPSWTWVSLEKLRSQSYPRSIRMNSFVEAIWLCGSREETVSCESQPCWDSILLPPFFPWPKHLSVHGKSKQADSNSSSSNKDFWCYNKEELKKKSLTKYH